MFSPSLKNTCTSIRVEPSGINSHRGASYVQRRNGKWSGSNVRGNEELSLSVLFTSESLSPTFVLIIATEDI